MSVRENLEQYVKYASLELEVDSPAERAALGQGVVFANALLAVLEIHKPVRAPQLPRFAKSITPPDREYCNCCNYFPRSATEYPCATVQAIENALGVSNDS